MAEGTLFGPEIRITATKHSINGAQNPFVSNSLVDRKNLISYNPKKYREFSCH